MYSFFSSVAAGISAVKENSKSSASSSTMDQLNKSLEALKVKQDSKQTAKNPSDKEIENLLIATCHEIEMRKKEKDSSSAQILTINYLSVGRELIENDSEFSSVVYCQYVKVFVNNFYSQCDRYVSRFADGNLDPVARRNSFEDYKKDVAFIRKLEKIVNKSYFFWPSIVEANREIALLKKGLRRVKRLLFNQVSDLEKSAVQLTEQLNICMAESATPYVMALMKVRQRLNHINDEINAYNYQFAIPLPIVEHEKASKILCKLKEKMKTAIHLVDATASTLRTQLKAEVIRLGKSAESNQHLKWFQEMEALSIILNYPEALKPVPHETKENPLESQSSSTNPVAHEEKQSVLESQPSTEGLFGVQQQPRIINRLESLAAQVTELGIKDKQADLKLSIVQPQEALEKLFVIQKDLQKITFLSPNKEQEELAELVAWAVEELTRIVPHLAITISSPSV